MLKVIEIFIRQIAADVGIPAQQILTYRPFGKKVREALLNEILREKAEFVFLNFEGIELCDVSFVDETIIELQISLSTKENVVICIKNMTQDTTENLRAALALKEQRGKKIQILIKAKQNYEYLGKIESNLEKTFQLVVDRLELTARDVASYYDIAINSASNRLKKLYDQRLVLRREEINEQGKQHLYFLP